jgi:hypothetical protein
MVILNCCSSEMRRHVIIGMLFTCKEYPNVHMKVGFGHRQSKISISEAAAVRQRCAMLMKFEVKHQDTMPVCALLIFISLGGFWP